jgi:RNA polymerase sigma-70 factor (ECF subfamily)
MSTITEQELTALLRAKEKRGFDLLYDKYGACLYLIIVRMVPDQEIAQQLLQESFVNIWRQAPGYNSAKSPLFVWLVEITRNTTYARMRSLAY